ncbi:uncharacterized protein LOC117332934 [Pecten maximus]|uniref:uncharacterized protein LOC117332934 n=1 Tax=Pecten maximus TaxID=6579 RepID=UPI001457F6C8|nr:uncharacterized protein LOC117332934 [Pecten maximus]
MSDSISLLILLAILRSLSAAEDDDRHNLSISKQEMNVFIDKLVTERMSEVESRFMKEISDLKAGYVLLESENNRLKSKIDTIETTVGLLEVENRMLHSKVDSLENELQMTKAVSSSKTSPVHSENETDVQNVYRRVAPDHPTGPQVAFKARLTHTLTDVGPREIIEFDAVELNIGDDYNPATSVFTCDTPGLYAFHLTMMLKLNKNVELVLPEKWSDVSQLLPS